MNTNSVDRRQEKRLGALALIGFGGAMLLYQVTPHFMHATLGMIMVALGFGALYLLGGSRFRWAKVPAIFFSALSGLAFLVSLPHEPFHMWWPLLIVAAGLWLMRRDRHRWVR